LALRWIVLLAFVATALYFLAGAVQTADFSVPADLAASEHYKKESIQFLMLSGACLMIGILVFLVLLRRSRR
jgi:hypothetical protein